MEYMFKKGSQIDITCEKMIFGGQALGRIDGKIALLWGALAGETVQACIIKNKKSYVEGIVQKVITSSRHRISAEEDHFLCCSPWQIMSFDEENEWKKRIALELYHNIIPLLSNKIDLIADCQGSYHYRNKMEYSFCNDSAGRLSLAFYNRGSHTKKPITPCKLALPCLNNTAQKIVQWLDQHKFPVRSLKSLIVRGNEYGHTIAALFIKDRVSILKSPAIDEQLKGLQIYYSYPRSPASRPDELLLNKGQDFIETEINTAQLKYGLLSFFQINRDLFIKVINDIKGFLDPQKRLIDFYAGVGAISIPLYKYCKSCVLVENNEQAVQYARENIINNNVLHYSVKLLSTEKALDHISPENILIFDPPRSGLHKNIIGRILEAKPFRIIYLSCNFATHARDIQLILEDYKITFFRLYNFFPRTPHIEALCILDRKG